MSVAGAQMPGNIRGSATPSQGSPAPVIARESRHRLYEAMMGCTRTFFRLLFLEVLFCSEEEVFLRHKPHVRYEDANAAGSAPRPDLSSHTAR